MMTGRRPVRWWHAMLPAGLWLGASRLLMRLFMLWLRSGLPGRRLRIAVLIQSRRLSRIGFGVWKFWGRKWR